MDDLILEHLPTADRAAYLIWRKFRAMKLDLEELKAEAKLILVVEARKVDASRLKKINVRSYLLMTIKRRLMDCLRIEFGRSFEKVKLRKCKRVNFAESNMPAPSDNRNQDFEGIEAANRLASKLPGEWAKVVRYLISLDWCIGCNVHAAKRFGQSEANISRIRMKMAELIQAEDGQGWAEAFLRGEE